MPDKLDQHDIKDLRARANMSLQQMADYLRVAKQTVHRWEMGHNKPSQLAQRQLHRLNKHVGG